MHDLIVFCAGQKVLLKDLPATNIYIQEEQRYCDIWKCITTQVGTWYSLFSQENEIGGSKLCKSFGFDITLDLPDICEEDRECLTPYSIDSQYLNDFKIIIKYLLDCSPVKMVYILASYQSNDKEVVLGTYSFDKFLSMMDANKIYSNVCYIISKHPNALDL